MILPKLYAIVDVSCFALPCAPRVLVGYARDLAAGGATLIQYRNKVGSSREMLEHALAIRAALPRAVTLIMDDRADLCLAADYDGVHVGQDDLSPEGARPGHWRSLSWALHPQSGAIAPGRCRPRRLPGVLGRYFTTGSKGNPDPVVGLEVCAPPVPPTRKPLVAIGGITRANWPRCSMPEWIRWRSSVTCCTRRQK